MPRNESRGVPLSRGIRWWPFFGAIAFIISSQVALAHTFLITHGDVLVEECRASVELEVPVEDFVHWYGLGPDANGAISLQSFRNIVERHAFGLHRIFMIRDAEGNPLPSDPFSTSFDWPSTDLVIWGNLRSLPLKYATQFSYPCAPRFLTFQLSMGSDCPGVFWQSILSVRGAAADDQGRVLRLTSQGNVETVDLIWSDKQGRVASNSSESTCFDGGVAGLQSICAEINIQSASVEVRIAIPLALLQTWLVLTQNEDEFLDLVEQQMVAGKVRNLLADAVSVECEGYKYSAEIMEIGFLPLGAKHPTGERKRVSLLTGRLSARLGFGPIIGLDQADFQCNLFNNAVHSVTAIIGVDNAAIRHEFSGYRPRYHWQRKP